MPAAPEWIVIAVVALILLGPKKLPDLAKVIGRALGEIQRARDDFHREITGVPPLPKIEIPKGLASLQPPGAAELKDGAAGACQHTGAEAIPPPSAQETDRSA